MDIPRACPVFGGWFVLALFEAGIAFEHTRAPSVADTDWEPIVAYYDALLALAPGPGVALNRGLAVTELCGPDAGRAALLLLEGDPKLARYSFYWAARADIERRRGRGSEATTLYERAITLAMSGPERRSYERRLRELENQYWCVSAPRPSPADRS
jgi:predicted RNA polymerase sigma factor